MADVIAPYNPQFVVSRDEGVWDTQQLAAGAPPSTSGLSFFTQGIQGRNYADTNSELPGQLPGDREQRITGVKLYTVALGTDDSTSQAAASDISQYNLAVIEVYVNNNVSLRIPAIDAACGAIIKGDIGEIASAVYSPGSPHNMGYRITDPGRYIVVPPNATFSAKLLFSANAGTINTARYVRLYLTGPSAFQAGRA